MVTKKVNKKVRFVGIYKILKIYIKYLLKLKFYMYNLILLERNMCAHKSYINNLSYYNKTFHQHYNKLTGSTDAIFGTLAKQNTYHLKSKTNINSYKKNPK